MMHASRRSFSAGHEAVAFVLTVVEGPDVGRELTIDRCGLRSAVVGSSAACTMSLADPEVSRCHARLEITGQDLSICDLGAGDVIVNGATVKEAFLRGGELVRLGATYITVERQHVNAGADAPSSFGPMFGQSSVMRRCFAALDEVAGVDVSVVLIGEEGTGKHDAARGIHDASRRARGPFVELHPSSTPDAASVRAAVALARGGTLFVDGPTHLSLEAQVALRELLVARPDVRVLSATRRPLSREVSTGRMLPALAPLLGEASVELPPLRERDGDVARLARAFWRASAIPDGVVARDGDDSELPTDFLARYEGYEWPGNVRELRAAVIARQTIGPFSRARQRKAERADADALLDAIVDDGLALPDARQRILREFEGRYVVRALARNRTIGRAARAAGMAVRRLGLIAARRARASALDGAGRGSYDLHR